MFLEESREPTEHILNEMMEQPEAFRKICSGIIFVVQSESALQDPTMKRRLPCSRKFRFIMTALQTTLSFLEEECMWIMKTSAYYCNIRKNEWNFATSGYNVGTGDMLLRLM